MPDQPPRNLTSRDDQERDFNFLPEFAWALVGGLVVLGVCALLYSLIVTWGGLRLDAALPTGPAAPLSAYARELAALFVAGALVVLVVRSLSARTVDRSMSGEAR
jgi:amino acid transporter